MILRSARWSLLGSTVLCLSLSSCGIQSYPGQPGVRTNGFAKIDMEYLDEAGLWVYEVTYDNANGGGVEQIVTKLYPGAFTYTSNVRTNADGTNLRHKFAAQGALLQMISLPKQDTVILSPESQVTIMISYDKSLNEVDDRNLSEEKIFGKPRGLSQMVDDLRWKWDILRAGQFEEGRLAYHIQKIKLGDQELDLSAQPLLMSTTLSQTGISLNASAAQKQILRSFINDKFPKGFKGTVEVILSEGTSIKIPLGISTIESLKAAGTQLLIQDLNASTSPAQVKGVH